MDKLTDEQKRNWINSYLADTKADEAAVGLVNPGENRCYMNSALQSLLGVIPLVMFFSTGLYKDYMTKRLKSFKDNPGQLMRLREIVPLVDAVARFIDGYLSKYRTSALTSPFDCKEVRDVFCKIYEKDGFVVGHPAESYDFIMKFIADMFDIFCESNMYKPGDSEYKEDKDNSHSLEDELEKSKKSFGAQKSFFGDLFDFLELETKECKKCKSEIYKIEHKLDMMLKMPANKNMVPIAKSILDLFKNTFPIEEVEFKCPNCSNSESVKRNNLYSVPNYFVVPVNRLYFDNKYQQAKYSGNIDIPLEICLDDYVANNNFKSVKYKPVGITRHIGGAGGGHYISYVNKKGKWFCLNDSSAKAIEQDDMLKDAVLGQTSVIYKRSDIDYLKFFEKHGYDIVGAIQRQNQKAWKDFDDWKNDLCNMDPECKVIFDNKDKEINELAEKKDKEVVIQKINKLRKDIEANPKIKEQNKIRNKAENQKALDTFVKEISAKFPETVKNDNVKSKIEAMKKPAKLELSTEKYIQEINNTVKIEINKIVNKEVADEFDAYKNTYDENSKLISEIKVNQAYKNIPIPKINKDAFAELKKIIKGIDADLKVEKTDEDFKKKDGVLDTFKKKNDYKQKFLNMARADLSLLEFERAISDFKTFLDQQEKNGDNIKFIIQRMKKGQNYKLLLEFDTSKFEFESKDFSKKMTAFKEHLEALKKKYENKDSKVVIEEIEKLESYKKLLSVNENGLTKEILMSFFKDFDMLPEKYNVITNEINKICNDMHYDELKDKDNGLEMDPEDFKNAIDVLKGQINKFLNKPLLNNLKENKKYADVLFPNVVKSLEENLIKPETEFNKALSGFEKRLDNAVENLKLVNDDLEILNKDKKYENIVNHEITRKKYDELFSEENLGESVSEYKKLVEDYKNTLENLRFVNDDLEKIRQKDEYKNHLDKLKEQHDSLLTEENLRKNPDEYKKLAEDYKVNLWIEYIVSVTMSEERKKFNSELINFLPDDKNKKFLKKLIDNDAELRKFLKDNPEIRAEFETMQKIEISKEQRNEIEEKLSLKKGVLVKMEPHQVLNTVGQYLKESADGSKILTKMTVILGGTGLISTSGLLVAMFLIPIPPIQIALIVAGSATGVFAIEEGVRKTINHSNYKKAKKFLDVQTAKTTPLFEKAKKSDLIPKTPN